MTLSILINPRKDLVLGAEQMVKLLLWRWPERKAKAPCATA